MRLWGENGQFRVWTSPESDFLFIANHLWLRSAEGASGTAGWYEEPVSHATMSPGGQFEGNGVEGAPKGADAGGSRQFNLALDEILFWKLFSIFMMKAITKLCGLCGRSQQRGHILMPIKKSGVVKGPVSNLQGPKPYSQYEDWK